MVMGLQLRFRQRLDLRTHLTLWISRETELFVIENYDHKEELRSRNELLTAERGSNSSKETCASPPSNPVSDSFFKKTVIPER